MSRTTYKSWNDPPSSPYLFLSENSGFLSNIITCSLKTSCDRGFLIWEKGGNLRSWILLIHEFRDFFVHFLKSWIWGKWAVFKNRWDRDRGWNYPLIQGLCHWVMKFPVDLGIVIFKKNGPNSGAVIAPPSKSRIVDWKVKGQWRSSSFFHMRWFLVPRVVMVMVWWWWWWWWWRLGN